MVLKGCTNVTTVRQWLGPDFRFPEDLKSGATAAAGKYPTLRSDQTLLPEWPTYLRTLLASA